LEDAVQKRLAATLIIAAVAATGATSATETPDNTQEAPALEVLVATALERSPALAALREKLAAAREMIAPAGALPDPIVEVMLQDVSFPKYTVGTQEMSMIGPEVRQALPFPGKRAARSSVARADAEIRSGELDQLRRQLVAQVRQIYARVYALDKESATLSEARQLLDMLAATAAVRYSVGETGQEAVIKAQIEVSRLEERTDDLAAERADLVAALNRLLDQPGATPLGRVAALSQPTVPSGPWEDAVLSSSAEVAIRRAAVAAAEKRLDVARLDLKPDFTTGAGVGLRGGFDPAVTLQFGIELPLWRNEKQRPLIRAAEHELEMAKAELRDAEATARSEAERLRADWGRADKQIVRYREAIIPRTSAAVDAARASYLTGQGDFLTVVEDFRLWLDARTEFARREAERFSRWSDLDALTHDQKGGPPLSLPAAQGAPDRSPTCEDMPSKQPSRPVLRVPPTKSGGSQ
jgi:outer membrane protein TolC